MLSKIKNEFLMCFVNVAVIFIITMGKRVCTSMTNFIRNILDYFHKGIYFPNNGYHGNSKRAVSQLS